MNSRGADLLHTEYPEPKFLISTDSLPAHRIFPQNDIVAVEYGKGFVGNKGAGAIDGMAQAASLLLAYKIDIGPVGDVDYIL